MMNSGVSKRWPSQLDVESREFFRAEYPVIPIETSESEDAWVRAVVKYADYQDMKINAAEPWSVNDLKVPSFGLYEFAKFELFMAVAAKKDWVYHSLHWLNCYLVGVGQLYYWHDRIPKATAGKGLSMT